jgi:hypothetical protein
MPRKPTKTREQKLGEQAAGRNDVTPAVPVPEAPDSIISRTAPALHEVAALDATALRDMFNIDELEMRIGLLSRIVIEHSLRNAQLSPREKADIALRAITVLEGSKQEVTWRDELARKPKPITIEAYKRERQERETRLKKMLLRKKEVQVRVGEEALKAAGEKEPNDDGK